jgi:hypothetical protein
MKPTMRSRSMGRCLAAIASVQVLVTVLAASVLAVASEPATGQADFTVIPRGAETTPAFQRLRNRGLAVVQLGPARQLIVPAELRSKPVDGRELVKAVSAFHELKVAWLEDGRLAVIQRGAADAEVEKRSRRWGSLEATKPWP